MFTRREASPGHPTGIDLDARLGDRTRDLELRAMSDPRWLRHRLRRTGEVSLRDRLARTSLAPAR